MILDELNYKETGNVKLTNVLFPTVSGLVARTVGTK